MILPDGTRLDSGLQIEERDLSGNSLWFPQYAYVVSVYGVDHPNNISQFRVECDIVLKETDLPILNVPVIQCGDGFNNFDEWYPEPAKRSVLPGAVTFGVKKEKTNFDHTDGDEVLVLFINGSPRRPIIIGSTGHPYSKEKATIEDGNRRRSLINNIRRTINKDGEYEFETRYPNQYERETLKQDPSQQKGVKFEVLKDNTVVLKIATGEAEKFIEINISPSTKTISTKASDQFEETLNWDAKTHEVKYDIENQELIDKIDWAGKKQEIKWGKDGEVTQEVDWAAKKTTLKDKNGDAQLVLDFASKKCQIQFDNTEIGKAALEWLIKGDAFKTWAESVLKLWADTHVHTGNLGYPTGPALAPLVAPTPDVYSTKNKVE